MKFMSNAYQMWNLLKSKIVGIILIPFFIALVLIYFEQWPFSLLFLFPIITWGTAFFFAIMAAGKELTTTLSSYITFEPFGSVRKNVLIFGISSLIQHEGIVFFSTPNYFRSTKAS